MVFVGWADVDPDVFCAADVEVAGVEPLFYAVVLVFDVDAAVVVAAGLFDADELVFYVLVSIFVFWIPASNAFFFGSVALFWAADVDDVVLVFVAGVVFEVDDALGSVGISEKLRKFYLLNLTNDLSFN